MPPLPSAVAAHGNAPKSPNSQRPEERWFPPPFLSAASGERTCYEATRRKTAAPPGNWGKRGVTGMRACVPAPRPLTWDVGTNVRRAGCPMDCVVENFELVLRTQNRIGTVVSNGPISLPFSSHFPSFHISFHIPYGFPRAFAMILRFAPFCPVSPHFPARAALRNKTREHQSRGLGRRANRTAQAPRSCATPPPPPRLRHPDTAPV